MKIVRMALCAVLSLLLLCFSALAVTQEDLLSYAVANGSVGAQSYADIVAPYSGTLAPFTIEAGDAVEAGEELFSVCTTSFFAPEQGLVSYIFVEPGQSAQDVLSRYGALISIEPAQQKRIAATTDGAYSKEKNHILHVGETLYFKSTGTQKEEGTGRVISVSGKNYLVDILTGNFELDDQLTLYRDDDYETKDSVGKGRVTLRDPLSISGMGVVSDVLVQSGDTVQPGQELLRCMGVDAPVDASPVCTSPAAGVVGSVAVAPGQQVWKGQLLARVLKTDALELVAMVDEIYLHSCQVGAVLPVTFDTDESRIFECTITEVSSLGVTMQNAAYYSVRLAVPTGANAMLGQSAKLYLPK